MNTILFNNEALYRVDSFNKTTNFSSESVSSSGYISLRMLADSPDLNTLAEDTITSIKILHDEDIIYNSQNLNGHITSISEFLNGDRVDITINLVF